MTARLFETWEELPTRQEDCVERFDIPDGVGVVYVLEYSRQSASSVEEHNALLKDVERVAGELRAKDPDAVVLALPTGWVFRVVRIEKEAV